MILTRRRDRNSRRSDLAAPAILHAQTTPWTYAAYVAAMKASGRNTRISADEWTEMQKRRPRALGTIAGVLNYHFGKADPEIMRAFREVPREYYHYDYGANTDLPPSPTRRNRSLGASAWARHCRIIAARPT